MVTPTMDYWTSQISLAVLTAGIPLIIVLGALYVQRRRGRPFSTKMWVVIGVVAIVLATLSRGVVPRHPYPQPHDAAALTVTPGATAGPIIDVPTGGCFNEVRGADGITWAVVSCDGPHHFEMIGSVELPEGPEAPYPGDEAIDEQANRLCIPLFEKYVGIDYDISRLVTWFYTPDAVTWPLGHRVVECMIGNEDRSMQPPGSVRNARR
jgi:hypothetical protein